MFLCSPAQYSSSHPGSMLLTVSCNEAGDCGKGSNTVISQLHFFLEHHGLGKEDNVR